MIPEPLISVTLNGVGVAGLVPTARAIPRGLDRKDSTTVFGWSVALLVAWSPPESVAVSCSSRYDGY